MCTYVYKGKKEILCNLQVSMQGKHKIHYAEQLITVT